MWKYIILVEDGSLYGRNELSSTQKEEFEDGTIRIIRTEDSKEILEIDINDDYVWKDLEEYPKDHDIENQF